MIAVALTAIQRNFHAGVAPAAWVVSSFYITAAIGQPLLGRVADQVGRRRTMCLGLAVTAVTGGLAPFAPSLTVLVVFRALQALGTSAAFPAALSVIRDAAPDGLPPPGAMATLAMANLSSAALGPVIGGLLIALAGWPAVFLVNVPVSLVGLVLTLRWVPADRKDNLPRLRDVVRALDIPGVALFAISLVSLLGFLLSLSGTPLWALLGVLPVAVLALHALERRAARPFLDVRMLAQRPPLLAVYAEFAAVSLVYYVVFYGLPIWLEQGRGFDAHTVGLLMVPIAGFGIATTPVAARLMARAGARSALVSGACFLVAGPLLLLLLGPGTPVIVILAVGAVLGVPQGFTRLALQTRLYRHVPVGYTGTAGGLLQTSRYFGAILSTSLIGLAFGGAIDENALHTMALVMAAVAVVVLLVSLRPEGDPSEL